MESSEVFLNQNYKPTNKENWDLYRSSSLDKHDFTTEENRDLRPSPDSQNNIQSLRRETQPENAHSKRIKSKEGTETFVKVHSQRNLFSNGKVRENSTHLPHRASGYSSDKVQENANSEGVFHPIKSDRSETFVLLNGSENSVQGGHVPDVTNLEKNTETKRTVLNVNCRNLSGKRINSKGNITSNENLHSDKGVIVNENFTTEEGINLSENVNSVPLQTSDADDIITDMNRKPITNQSSNTSDLSNNSDMSMSRTDSPIFNKSSNITASSPSAFTNPSKDKRQEKPTRKFKIDNKEIEDIENNPDVARFLQANDTSDLRLVVEGKPLYVSRIVLSIISPVLKQIFDNRTRESSVVEIPLVGKKFDEMLEFLCCVYPDKLKPVTDKNVVQLLSLSDELQVETLKSRCEHFLLNELKRSPPSVSPEFLIFNMQLADRYNLELVKKQCFEVATRTSTDALENVAGFWELPHLTTSGIFLQRLKLFEQAARKISKRLNEAETHCSLYHKNERWGDNLCNKCLASVGKVASSEMAQL